jgi:hypothetical protein
MSAGGIIDPYPIWAIVSQPVLAPILVITPGATHFEVAVANDGLIVQACEATMEGGDRSTRTVKRYKDTRELVESYKLKSSNIGKKGKRSNDGIYIRGARCQSRAASFATPKALTTGLHITVLLTVTS